MSEKHSHSVSLQAFSNVLFTGHYMSVRISTESEQTAPAGGGAIKGLGDAFQASGFSGGGSYSIPLPLPAARALTPEIALSYHSGGGNGSFGMGFSLGLSSISRKTSKGVPHYDERDVFLLGETELLCALDADGQSLAYTLDDWTITPYLPRMEGSFARIEHHQNHRTSTSFWKVISGHNTTTILGRSIAAQIANPEASTEVFKWLIEEEVDPNGNRCLYTYRTDAANELDTQHANATNACIDCIEYGNYESEGSELFAFTVRFLYAEFNPEQPDSFPTDWSLRSDPFSSFRSGFEVRNLRLCRGIAIYHHFTGEFNNQSVLTNALHIAYNRTEIGQHCGLSFLERVTHWGYRQNDIGATIAQSTPPLDLSYQRCTPEQGSYQPLMLEGGDTLPGYLWQGQFSAADLHSEGLPGFLLSNEESTLYWEPVGNGRYRGPIAPAEFPLNKNIEAHEAVLTDLEGNGYKSLVTHAQPGAGYYTSSHQGVWEPFVPFPENPIELTATTPTYVDVTGNGWTDALYFEGGSLRWYPSLGKQGFASAHVNPLPGGFPAVDVAAKDELITFSDMSGDGLADRVKITNGNVVYWPNAGHGRFAAPVQMASAPSVPERLNAERLHLADIDGSGTTDLVYFEHNHATIWFNQSGNGFGEPVIVKLNMPFNSISEVNFADVLGNGTNCMVLTRIEPEVQHFYYPIAGSAKPYLLSGIENNIGTNTEIKYSTSVQQYLADKRNGRVGATRLSFPVQVVSEVTVTDQISGAFHCTRHAYHDGYFDPEERVFRGFGFVESWDTESYENFEAGAANAGFPVETLNKALHVPPTYSKSWYHTGAYRKAGAIEAHYQQEYFQGDAQAVSISSNSFSPNFKGCDAETYRQGFVALEGQVLREEIYGLDGSAVEANPYTVSETHVRVRLLQSRHNNRYAVCFPFTVESIDWHYERNANDPRISHSLTLKTDVFGNVERSAAISYPRRAQTDSTVFPEQEALHVVVSETAFASLVENEPGTQPCRWIGVSVESQSYQLNATAFPSGQLEIQTVAELVATALNNPVPNHHPFDGTSTPQARLLSDARSYFWNDDQSECAALGQLSYRNLPHHTETALGTSKFYQQVYGDRITADLLQNEAGYVLNEDYWWKVSPTTFFHSEPQKFYLPCKTENTRALSLPPTGNATTSSLYVKSTTTYDDYALFPVTTAEYLSDSIQLITATEIDYQSLQPWRVTDANQNATEVLFDALGEVIASTHYGQIDGRVTGNNSIADYRAIPATFEQVLANPESYLQGAGSYYYYDHFAWMERQQPPSFIALEAEQYVSQMDADAERTILQAVSYADGFGRAIESKHKTEGGPVQVRVRKGTVVNPASKGPQASYSAERWVTSGRTVYNNKGKPAQQYKPYYTESAAYENQNTIELEGLVPPPAIVHYDPLERTIRTDDPKGFHSRVEFTPWMVRHFDANDTLTDSSYYQQYNGKLPANEQDALDKALACAHTPSIEIIDNLGRTVRFIENNLGIVRAAQLAELCANHSDTPEAVFSSLVNGNVLTALPNEANAATLSERTLLWNAALVAQLTNQFPAIAPALLTLLYQARMTTLVVYDIQGHSLLSIDPRLYAQNVAERKADFNLRHTYNMVGETLHTESCDAGVSLALSNQFGKPIRSWDGRGNIQALYYDALQRPTSRMVAGNGLDNVTETIEYGEAQPNASGVNLMGQPYRAYDEAGLTTIKAYSLDAHPLTQCQQLREDYKSEANWTVDAMAEVQEAERFITIQEIDALGRLVREITPDKSITTPTYTQTGALKSVSVTLANASSAEQTSTIIENVEYDALAQPTAIAYGNGVQVRFQYESTTQRLLHYRSFKTTGVPEKGDVLQDIAYYYDPVGNITRKSDASWNSVFASNQQVDPLFDYHYDPVYRLTQASGRQLKHTGAVPDNLQWLRDKGISLNIANANDLNQLENYTQRYAYDTANNLLALQHRASKNWHHRFAMDSASNRLANSAYDGNGNMEALNHLQNLVWDYRNNLASATMVERADDRPMDTEYYMYNANGTRVRKVTERLAANGQVAITDKIYLGSYQRTQTYTQTQTGDSTLVSERNTLTVNGVGDTACVVQRWKMQQQTPASSPPQFRYQLSDGHNSVSMEVDAVAKLITYEEYFPFGSTAFSVGSNAVEVALKEYRYSGQERDATGLYYYGARYYPPWLCRWLKPDPGGEIDGLNFYAFVGGSPVTHVDDGGYVATRSRGAALSPGLQDKERAKSTTPSGPKVIHGNTITSLDSRDTMHDKSEALGRQIAQEINRARTDYTSDLTTMNAEMTAKKAKHGMAVQDESLVSAAIEAGLKGNHPVFDAKWHLADTGMDEHLSTITAFYILKGAGKEGLTGQKKANLVAAMRVVSQFRTLTTETGYSTSNGSAQHPTAVGKEFWAPSATHHGTWNRIRRFDAIVAGSESKQKGVFRLLDMAAQASGHTLSFGMAPATASDVTVLGTITDSQKEGQIKHRDVLKKIAMRAMRRPTSRLGTQSKSAAWKTRRGGHSPIRKKFANKPATS